MTTPRRWIPDGAGRFQEVPFPKPRHYLVIRPSPPGTSVWEIEHDPSCQMEFETPSFASDGAIRILYRCAVADEVGYSGLDYLEADEFGGEWTSLPPGRYEIEAYSQQYGDGYGGPGDVEHGLRVVRRVPQIVATVISV